MTSNVKFVSAHSLVSSKGDDKNIAITTMAIQ